MAIKNSDAPALKQAITEAVKQTLQRFERGGVAVRESEEQREVRLKEQRREQKHLTRETRAQFEQSGMDKKTAKKAAKLVESDAYRHRAGY